MEVLPQVLLTLNTKQKDAGPHQSTPYTTWVSAVFTITFPKSPNTKGGLSKSNYFFLSTFLNLKGRKWLGFPKIGTEIVCEKKAN